MSCRVKRDAHRKPRHPPTSLPHEDRSQPAVLTALNDFTLVFPRNPYMKEHLLFLRGMGVACANGDTSSLALLALSFSLVCVNGLISFSGKEARIEGGRERSEGTRL